VVARLLHRLPFPGTHLVRLNLPLHDLRRDRAEGPTDDRQDAAEEVATGLDREVGPLVPLRAFFRHPCLGKSLGAQRPRVAVGLAAAADHGGRCYLFCRGAGICARSGGRTLSSPNSPSPSSARARASAPAIAPPITASREAPLSPPKAWRPRAAPWDLILRTFWTMPIASIASPARRVRRKKEEEGEKNGFGEESFFFFFFPVARGAVAVVGSSKPAQRHQGHRAELYTRKTKEKKLTLFLFPLFFLLLLPKQPARTAPWSSGCVPRRRTSGTSGTRSRSPSSA
jgi:hypothetical protein